MNQQQINKLAEEIIKKVQDEAYRRFPISDDTVETEPKRAVARNNFFAGAEFLHSITAAKEDKAGMKWVSVNDRLPKKRDLYVCKIQKQCNGETSVRVEYRDFKPHFPDFDVNLENNETVIEWLDESPSPSSQSEDIAVGFAVGFAEISCNEQRRNCWKEYKAKGEDFILNAPPPNFDSLFRDYKLSPEYNSLPVGEQPLPDGGIDWKVMYEEMMNEIQLHQFTPVTKERFFNWFKARPEFKQGRFTEQDKI